MVYKLSATLAGHSQDVRGVASPTAGLVLSVSRDTTAIAWARPDASAPFAPATPFQAGSRFINAVAYLPPSAEAPQGSLISGGQDTVINIFPLGTQQTEPSHSLLGHTENVCALDATPGGTIVSGSWDKTARVWKNFVSVHELKGHGQAVWAVLAVDDSQVLTGSADKTIKLWTAHKNTFTFNGHTDAVRGLALIPDIGFASCSNDSEIRVWTLGGDTIHVLSGHTSFVYSLAVLPNGDIVSGGEDRSVRVWKDGECSQVIVHPAISVWAVSVMPNGDIVSGSSDSVVRVFSESKERWASEADIKEYENSVSSQALPSQQVGDVKKSDLPGPEALSQPGKKEGQVIMVRSVGGSVEAHQWSSQSSSWQKIGEVVDAVGSGRKQLYQGKEYDYVFDVDIKDGAPPLKLPFNTSENPFQAALKFLQSNDLPESYIDEVVKFIEKNTAGTQLGAASSEYVDPYTGASRYQASSSSVPTTTGGSYQDPFTGAGGYHGGGAPTTHTPGGSFVDPFTGASGYHGASSTPSQPPPPPQTSTPSAASGILPVVVPLPFRQANLPAMNTKLNDINAALAADPSTASLAFTEDEKATIDRVFAFITEAAKVPITIVLDRDVAIEWSDVETVLRVTHRWPEEKRFPLIDLTRLIAAYSPVTLTSSSNAPVFLQSIFEASGWSAPQWPATLPKHVDTNILLGLRALANLFQARAHGNVLGLGSWNVQVFEELLKPSFSALTKNHWVALGTIALNYSSVELKGIDEKSRQVLSQFIVKILSAEGADSEGQYRALVALGNVLYGAKHIKPLSAVAVKELRGVASQAGARLGDDRSRTIVNEISKLV